MAREDLEIIKKFSELDNLYDVANILEIPAGQLRGILYGGRSGQYQKFLIPKKSGGARQILAPRSDLKVIQRKLNYVLSLVYKPKLSVYGFARNKNVLLNAKQHIRKNFVLNLDLEDFFPSINFGRVWGMLQAKPYNIHRDAATVIAQICCFENTLPQGAPTSPIISNMVCAKFDASLHAIANKHKCTYTRYADDISFSTTKNAFPEDILERTQEGIELGDVLANAIIENGFRLNKSKVRLRNKRMRQEVTGLVVNEFPNVKRKYVRQIRAMLYAWNKHGLGRAQEYYFKDAKDFVDVLMGKINFLRLVRGGSDQIFRKLAGQFNSMIKKEVFKLDASVPPPNRKFDVFICHASEDKERFVDALAEALKKEGVEVWYDKFSLKWGDDLLRSIAQGQANSRYGIVVFSEHFLGGKKWTEHELGGLFAKENLDQTVILPIWLGITHDDILKYNPALANRIAIRATDVTSIPLIVARLKKHLA